MVTARTHGLTETAHWLAVEGVQHQYTKPYHCRGRAQELVPKGPGASQSLAALAGNDNVVVPNHKFKPRDIERAHVLFDKFRAAILDEDPDEEVIRSRSRSGQRP